MTERHVPRSDWLARLAHATLGHVITACFHTTSIGADNIPASGGVILAGNHVSYADPVLIWCSSRRPVHFMAKAELWASSFGWAADHLWAFPVRRGAPDREAISTACGLLRAGEIVGMFPEGTRARAGEGAAHGGVAFLALRENVRVVPVGVAGTTEILPPGTGIPRFPHVVLSYGEPLAPGEFNGESRRERTDAMTSAIMARIAEEIERAEARR